MVTKLKLGAISVDVVRKDIKNIHLSVYPPNGRVHISAPSRLSLETIRVFAISKLSWIKNQRQKVLAQERESQREYLDRESHYVWGRRYLLKVLEHDAAPCVELRHSKLILQVRPGTSAERRREIIEEWYRGQLRIAVAKLLTKWQPIMRVKPNGIFVQRMKTKWGSCSRRTRNIRLNTDLAKKPADCLEYIVVHEMVHLIEPTHNRRFIELMNRSMPRWQFYRTKLNRLPLRQESWEY